MSDDVQETDEAQGEPETETSVTTPGGTEVNETTSPPAEDEGDAGSQ